MMMDMDWLPRSEAYDRAQREQAFQAMAEQIMFGQDVEMRAAAAELRAKGWSYCRLTDAMQPLVKLLDRLVEEQVSLNSVGLFLRRAAERLIGRGVLVLGDGAISFDPDVAREWQQHRNLLSLFLRDEVVQAATVGTVASTISGEEFGAIEKKLRATKIEPLPLELLRYCWSQGSVDIRDLHPAVWLDEPPTADQVKAASGRANRALADVGIPRSLSWSAAGGGRIFWK